MDVLLAMEGSGTVEVQPASGEFWSFLVSVWKEADTGLGKLSSFLALLLLCSNYQLRYLSIFRLLTEKVFYD